MKAKSQPTWPFEAPPPISLVQSPVFMPVTAAIKAALDAVHPMRAVLGALTVAADSPILQIHNRAIPIDHPMRIRVVGGGKAGANMASAVYQTLGSFIDTGMVAIKQDERNPSIDSGPIAILESAHPIPAQSSVNASKRILALIDDLTANDLVIVLISGGASSLLTLPAPPVTLSDLQNTTDLLLKAGIDIAAINTVRKHLSQFKGGELARRIHPAKSISLILSDVVGDPLDAIGSGPTAPDKSTFQDAMKILCHANLFHRLPNTVQHRLTQGVEGRIPDTPKQNDACFEQGSLHLVCTNKMAQEAAHQAFSDFGIQAHLVETPLVGEARTVGQQLIENLPPVSGPHVWIFGGETTVTVTGTGMGGRNQELALAAASSMAKRNNMLLLTVATDGGDGPTPAAGAAVTPDTLKRAVQLGLDPVHQLQQNNAYLFFHSLDDLLVTGPTHTNVADLTFLLTW